MGSYSILEVGRVTFAWKYRIPTFATFLFEQRDYYERPRGDPMAPDYDHMRTIGYRSTAGAVKARLDDLGFTLPFFGGVCDEVLAEALDYQVDALAEALPAEDDVPFEHLQAEARKYLRRPARRSAADDITAFVDILCEAVNEQGGPPGSRAAVGRFKSEEGDILLNPSELAFEIGRRPLDFDPGVMRISGMLDETSFEDYPEVVDLFCTRCLIEAVDPDTEVHLDLSDVWDEGDDLSNQPAELANELLRKLQVYTRVFGVLSENEPDVRRLAARGQARHLMQLLDEAQSADEKGRVLEELMAAIFEGHPDLNVSERRLNLGDQEIDLVVDNHVDHAFWTKLESPFFFVECKNWASSVGASEVRDFETKLRDHPPHVRLGLLVAVGGFSSETKTALARASREQYQLVLVTRSDIEDLIDTGFDVLSWLEGLIARFH